MPNRYYGYEQESHFQYWTYDRECVFSSETDRREQRSYQDEYDWFVDTCEEYGYEPECYED